MSILEDYKNTNREAHAYTLPVLYSKLSLVDWSPVFNIYATFLDIN